MNIIKALLPDRDEGLRGEIIQALRHIRDPEIPVNIYDLGLIYGLDIDARGQVDLRMTLTTPSCPMAQSFPAQVTALIEKIPGVAKVNIELVWEPPWNVSRVSEAARLEMGVL
jgi:FeS assembly SUF system protein